MTTGEIAPQQKNEKHIPLRLIEQTRLETTPRKLLTGERSSNLPAALQSFLNVTKELWHGNIIDVLFHPVDRTNWKSMALYNGGMLAGVDMEWCHVSLRVSMPRSELGEFYGDPVHLERFNGRHTVTHELVDVGVQSCDDSQRRTTGIVRLFPTEEWAGLKYIDDVITQIQAIHERQERMHWLDCFPILFRGEPFGKVCTTFVQEALRLEDQQYMFPKELYAHLLTTPELNHRMEARVGINWPVENE